MVNTTDSTLSMFRRKTVRVRHFTRFYRPWVMDSSQRISLYIPKESHGVNKSSGQEVKDALRRMRSSGTRKIYK